MFTNTGLVAATVSVLAWMLCSLPTAKMVLLAGIFAAVFVGFRLVALCESVQVKKLAMVCFLLLCQCALGTIALLAYPDKFVLFVIASTVLLCDFEISVVHERWLSGMLVARHVTMWYVEAIILEKATAGLDCPYFAIVLVFVATVVVSDQSRKSAAERFGMYQSVEKQRVCLKHILDSIPEGLVILTFPDSVLCHNGQIQSILQCDSSPSTSLLHALGAVHCLEKIDGDKLESLPLLQKVYDFLLSSSCSDSCALGVSPLQGAFYEWKGRICSLGSVKACIVTVTDVTPWAALTTRLQQESDSKTALLRFVSHELRTPTNAIINLATSVRDSVNILPEQRAELSIVLSSSQLLLGVINDLLDFSRITVDKFVLVKQIFDIRKEIEETVQLMELQCTHKGLYLRLKTDSLLPCQAYSDKHRLKQVMLNLLSNALKFTFVGGIDVVCELTDRDTMRVSVSDTGLGIAPEQVSPLFKLFSKVKGTEAVNPQGCGLGLYISNLIAKVLGPKPIEIRSTEGVGSTFSFEVNIFERKVETEGVQDDTTSDVSTEREVIPSLPSTPIMIDKDRPRVRLPDILVVDDCEFNRVVLIKMLHSFNLTCDEACTGRRALFKIQSRKERGHYYRLIFMDMEMPEMDGVSAAEEIRSMVQRGDLTVSPRLVACSAHRSKDDCERCLKAGMDEYLEKPISRGRLREVVGFLLSLP